MFGEDLVAPWGFHLFENDLLLSLGRDFCIKSGDEFVMLFFKLRLRKGRKVRSSMVDSSFGLSHKEPAFFPIGSIPVELASCATTHKFYSLLLRSEGDRIHSTADILAGEINIGSWVEGTSRRFHNSCHLTSPVLGR